MDRRDFLERMTRLLLLALLGLVSGLAFFHRREGGASACPPGVGCRSCGQAANCTLAQKQGP
jgi:hypothetical protein